MTIGSIGCFLSHLRAWSLLEKALGGTHHGIVIFEDDAYPTEQYLRLSREERDELFSRVPADADLVLLGCNILGGLCSGTMDAELQRVYYFNGTFGYVLTPRGFKSLMPLMRRIRTHIDHQLSDILVKCPQTIHAYAFTKQWFGHDFSCVSDTDVDLPDLHRANEELSCYLGQLRQGLIKTHGIRLETWEDQEHE